MQILLRNSRLLARRAAAGLQAAAVACGLLGTPVFANNVGEDGAWNFSSGSETAVRQNSLDMLQKQRAGYYNAMQMTVNNVTNTLIQRQVNCSLSATTAGNTGTNGLTAYASSPTIAPSNSVSASTAANGASNYALPGGTGGLGLTSTQTSSGSLSSGVSNSNSGASTGSVSAGGGTASQVLNSAQTSSGVLTAGVQNSTACSGLGY